MKMKKDVRCSLTTTWSSAGRVLVRANDDGVSDGVEEIWSGVAGRVWAG